MVSTELPPISYSSGLPPIIFWGSGFARLTGLYSGPFGLSHRPSKRRPQADSLSAAEHQRTSSSRQTGCQLGRSLSANPRRNNFTRIDVARQTQAQYIVSRIPDFDHEKSSQQRKQDHYIEMKHQNSSNALSCHETTYRPFNTISEEILHNIFTHVLVHDSVIALDCFVFPHPRFTSSWTLLHVSRRFYETAVRIIYQQNTFLAWGPQAWPDFHSSRIQAFAVHRIKSLIIKWPNPLFDKCDDQATVDFLSKFTTLKKLKVVGLSKLLSEDIKTQLQTLSVKEIWFHADCRYAPDLSIGGLVRRSVSRFHKVFGSQEPMMLKEREQGYVRS